jgi:hypothetical protein
MTWRTNESRVTKYANMNNTFVSANMQALTNDTLICMVHYRLNFIMFTDVE